MTDDFASTDGVPHETLSRLPDEIADASIDIDAPPDEVYEALLDPEALASWFGLPGGGTTHGWSVDPTPGGAWRARGKAVDGTPVTLHGTVIRMEPPRTLEWRWFIGPDGAVPSTVRYDLEPTWRDGEPGTRLRVRHVAARPSLAPVTMGGMRVDPGYWSGQLRALCVRLAAGSRRFAPADR
jgi:uncharacterized protein YndB with AHSA1/START domain